MTIATATTNGAQAAVQLPNIFTDGMVLQRNTLVPIWGTATPGEVVTIEFNGREYAAITNEIGQFQVRIGPLKSGGPYQMTVKGSSTIVVRDVLVGEVWLCSGQSNMEWPLNWLPNYKAEIEQTNNPMIRQFLVKKQLSNQPKEELLRSSWIGATSKSLGQFTAVGYFFAKYIFEQLNVPVGIINASWGGTMIEPWISTGAIKAFPDIAANLSSEAYLKLPDFNYETSAGDFAKTVQEMRDQDLGMKERWYMPDSVSGWKEMLVPHKWSESELFNFDGTAWYRRSFQVTELVEKEAVLSLGKIDDYDEVWLNGELLGSTNNYDTFRTYLIGTGKLKVGMNTLVLRVTDTGGEGGFTSDARSVFVQYNQTKINLAGKWLFRLGTAIPAEKIRQKDPNSFPSTLNNAMIQPLRQYGIKGILWYQGESNVDRAARYADLMPALINDWRGQWQSNLPFLMVQLANFKQPIVEPAESAWAELREAQYKATTLSNTGVATAIDIGLANDIHPTNKKEVGRRLSLLARKLAYQEDIVAVGPTYQSMEVKDSEIHVKFTNLGGGLLCKSKYGYVQGFQIAGANQKFYWAKARIEGNRVVVSSELVKNPVAVRYAWADNPDDINLYNFENLPAYPFRSDNWPVLSTGKL